MALQNGNQVYQRLFNLFRRADDRYNSGLFHFREERGQSSPVDALTPNLTLDDKILKDIVKNLYYPDSPYEFSVLPADILGQVYEQFLGKVIRLTAGHQAKVEYKPEVRKAGGVYYTPTYIVDYIVRQTVGRWLEGKKPSPRSGAGAAKNPGPGLRFRFLSPGGLSIPAGLASHRLPGKRSRQVVPGEQPPHLPGPGRRLEIDHRRAQAPPPGPYLRGGHRLPGGGSDEIIPAPQGPGRRERPVGEGPTLAEPAGLARPGRRTSSAATASSARIFTTAAR